MKSASQRQRVKATSSSNAATAGASPELASSQRVNDPWQVSRLGAAWILVGIMVLGLALRLPGMWLSLWLDELHTSWVVQGTWQEVAARAKIGSSTPPYFWVVWGLTRWLGHSEFTLRLFSLVCGLAVLPVSYLVARGFGLSRALALWIAGLAMLDRERIYFAQEARPYALIELIALLQVYFFWRFIKYSTWVPLAVATSLALLLVHIHYATLLLTIAELIFVIGVLVVEPATFPRPRWNQLITGVAVFTVLSAPLFWSISQTVAARSSMEINTRGFSLVMLATIFPLHTYVFLPGALLLMLSRRTPETAERWSPAAAPLTFGLLWTLVPATIAWTANHFGLVSLFVRRYLVASAHGPLQMAGLLVNLAPHRKASLAMATIVLAAAGLTTSPLLGPGQMSPKHGELKESWREAIAYLNKQTSGRTTMVFLRSAVMESEDWWNDESPDRRAFCLFPFRGIYSVPAEEVVTLPISAEFKLTPRHLMLSQVCDERWMVCRRAMAMSDTDPADVTARELVRQLTTDTVEARLGPGRHFGKIAVFSILLSRREAAQKPNDLQPASPNTTVVPQP